MSDLEVEIVSAITLGLTYFYYKYKKKQSKRKVRHGRLWMSNIHTNRNRDFMENKFTELLNEPSGEFHSFCRMSYSDFEFLLGKISPLVAKKDTSFREAIPTKYRLAITLRFLASGESYRSLHVLFKVSTPMISKTVRDVCQALNEVLKEEAKMPSTAEGWMAIEEGYRRKFPHCLGSLDGKHVVIECPSHGGADYKKTFSIILFALVDSQYKFTFVDIGSQGRISDGSVFNNSVLWQRISSNEIDFPSPCPLPGSDVNVPYVFLADDTFTLNTHVMTPFPGSHDIGSPERKFNEVLSRSRVVVENTFGILSSTFRVFRRPINLNPDTVSKITMTCVLLHNFLRNSETSSNRYTPPDSFDVYDNNGTLITPGSWRRYDNEYNALQTLPSTPRTSPLNAQQIRKEFASYFCNNI